MPINDRGTGFLQHLDARVPDCLITAINLKNIGILYARAAHNLKLNLLGVLLCVEWPVSLPALSAFRS
jgi:hypothetical protein